MDPRLTAYTLFLVVSASHAIKGEKALAKAGIPCNLIPVPRAISSQCGVCLRVALADREQAERVLAEAGVPLAGSHDLPNERPRSGQNRARSHRKTEQQEENNDES